MMSDRIATIRTKIDELARVDTELRCYGASSHKYKPNSPLGAQEIDRYENQFGFQLPNEYRQYLIEIGNGGVGPGNGLLVFPNGDKRDPVLAPEKVTREFELDSPYRCWEHNDDDVELEHFDETCGTLRLTHYGCAIFAFLILNGPFKNQIWFWEPNGDTFQPEIDQAFSLPSKFPSVSTPFSFFDWYDNWLDISLYECKAEHYAGNGG